MSNYMTRLRSLLTVERYENADRAWVSPCGEFKLPHNGNSTDIQQAIAREFHLMTCGACA